MLIQNINDITPKVISAHGGEGKISMKFFHKKYQNYSEKLMNSNRKNPSNNSLWNFFAVAELDTDSTVKTHKHNKTDELYYIISGKAQMTVDGKRAEIKTGDVILTKSGSFHSIDEVNEKLIFIAVEVLTNG